MQNRIYEGHWNDTVTESLIINWKLISLFSLYASNDISTHLARTMETETAWVSISHSITTILVVRWHNLRTREVSGGRCLMTSLSWASKMEPAFMVAAYGSADRTMVAMNLAGYLSLEYITNVRDEDGTLFLPWTNSVGFFCTYIFS